MRRSGFSLVEMLVVLALTVFLMSIIATAFVTGLDAFRRLKGLADMDRELSAAGNLLRRDLQAAHFEGNLLLSEIPAGVRPPQGFFRYVESDAAGKIYEEPPAANVRARYFKDSLQFTVRLRSNRPDEFYTTRLSPGSSLAGMAASGHGDGRFQLPGNYSSQWAVVTYWLGSPAGPGRPLPDDAGESELAKDAAVFPPPYPTRVPLFNLYCRRQLLVPEYFTTPTDGLVERPRRAVALDPTDPNYAAAVAAALQSDVSVYLDPGPPPVAVFNSPVEIQDPNRRFGGANAVYAPLAGSRQGEDLLLANVLSFDVKYWDGQARAFVDLPATGPVYDTHLHGGPPAGSLTAVQIKLRVYDRKTQQTREVTLIVDM